jgi:hypothetical protein
MSYFTDEFKRRCKRINDDKPQPLHLDPPVYLYKITRYTSCDQPAVVMWNIPEEEALGLMDWKFKSHTKWDNGEEVLIWYKLSKMDNVF